MRKFDGKVVLITGATSGIGRHTALRFAREGACTLVTGLDEDKGSAVVEEIVSSGGEASFLVLDVADETMWTGTLERVIDRHGRLDVLVNNAGVTLGGRIAETELEDFRWVMAVNVEGVFLGLKHGIRVMKGRGGAIVNVSSTSALVGRALAGAIAASKAAVRSLTKTAALECAQMEPPIRINAVLPGGVDTNIWSAQAWRLGKQSDSQRFEAARRAIQDETPFKRLAQPWEIANAIVFLASDDCPFMTAADLVVDGGLTAH
ncbi:MAG: SDR family oxidoreductase [Burkholderiales bacterium]|nr:SDR family oxidoreductase [Burkholderiales bacterium]